MSWTSLLKQNSHTPDALTSLEKASTDPPSGSGLAWRTISGNHVLVHGSSGMIVAYSTGEAVKLFRSMREGKTDLSTEDGLLAHAETLPRGLETVADYNAHSKKERGLPKDHPDDDKEGIVREKPKGRRSLQEVQDKLEPENADDHVTTLKEPKVKLDKTKGPKPDNPLFAKVGNKGLIEKHLKETEFTGKGKDATLEDYGFTKNKEGLVDTSLTLSFNTPEYKAAATRAMAHNLEVGVGLFEDGIIDQNGAVLLNGYTRASTGINTAARSRSENIAFLTLRENTTKYGSQEAVKRQVDGIDAVFEKAAAKGVFDHGEGRQFYRMVVDRDLHQMAINSPERLNGREIKDGAPVSFSSMTGSVLKYGGALGKAGQRTDDQTGETYHDREYPVMIVGRAGKGAQLLPVAAFSNQPDDHEHLSRPGTSMKVTGHDWMITRDERGMPTDTLILYTDISHYNVTPRPWASSAKVAFATLIKYITATP